MDSGVYVRARNNEGKWAAVDAVYELDDTQFLAWVVGKLTRELSLADLPLTPDKRRWLIQRMRDVGITVYGLVPESTAEDG
jgi:hypothetical protein